MFERELVFDQTFICVLILKKCVVLLFQITSYKFYIANNIFYPLQIY